VEGCENARERKSEEMSEADGNEESREEQKDVVENPHAATVLDDLRVARIWTWRGLRCCLTLAHRACSSMTCGAHDSLHGASRFHTYVVHA
jgi:hypothetical protein